ncbi:MAG TPA: DUF2255 family protein [Candidatus Limnocylindrales bacterium]|nr:DUF2255 family protein [Candidatus Limnocylindrales bacterium]
MGTDWAADELDRIGRAVELRLASRREDGSLRPFTTMWVVRVGDDLYVRSAAGPDNPWFRRASHAAGGRIRAGGVERDVTFGTPSGEAATDITAAYHAKYGRYGPAIVGTVVSPEALRATLRLIPI